MHFKSTRIPHTAFLIPNVGKSSSFKKWDERDEQEIEILTQCHPELNFDVLAF
jgi:hypothetical protein